MRSLYLAGPMRGLEDMGRGLFNKAARSYESAGFLVLNPAALPVGLPDAAYMPICMAMIDAADAVMLLPGWRESEGARLERQYALYQGKQVLEDAVDHEAFSK